MSRAKISVIPETRPVNLTTKQLRLLRIKCRLFGLVTLTTNIITPNI